MAPRRLQTSRARATGVRGWFSSDDLANLSGSRNLKTLSVDTYAFDGLERREARTCLAAVGKLTQLERLHLNLFNVDDLACLKGLTNLRIAHAVVRRSSFDESEYDRDPLARLPALPRLEALRGGSCRRRPTKLIAWPLFHGSSPRPREQLAAATRCRIGPGSNHWNGWRSAGIR